MNRTIDLTTAVELALRAPSVHNTQPWRWRITGNTVELHADWGRHLVATDPDRRDLVLSCGAALHHLLVALAAQNLSVLVRRLPDPEDRRHLATVDICPAAAADAPADADLLAAIAQRRTDRRRFSDRPVPAADLQELVEQAEQAGARLIPVTSRSMRDRLAEALVEGAERQRYAPGYATELELWTRRYAAAHDGVPRSNITAPAANSSAHATSLRRFPHGQLRQPQQFAGHAPENDAAELLIIATPADTVLDRIRAGEATSAVLLAATRLRLATTPLSQGIEVDSTRLAIQRDVLHVPEYPQLLIRVGRPAPTATELPTTPRRTLRSVLLPPADPPAA